jgi:transcriptional regulator GlxA family with amidase domain
MAAIRAEEVAASGVSRFDREVLEALIKEACSSFETDRSKAKYCIQRAAELLGDRQTAELRGPGTLAVRGGLSAWQAKRVVTYIESNMAMRILTADLAAHVRLSLAHFCRTFRTSFGTTPQAYVMRRRILRAEDLMSRSDAPLATIALECGLCDQSHFSRAFRRIVGVSPNVWRRQARSVAPGD